MLSNSDDDFEELDVTVAIKIGGKTETQILHLHPSQSRCAGIEARPQFFAVLSFRGHHNRRHL